MKENYCICGHLVASDIERNEHILSHFKHKPCVSCDNQLIFVAGKWYQPHNDSNCIVVKEEPEIDCGIGFIPSDGNGANSIIGADNVIIQEAERSNEQNIHDNDVQQESSISQPETTSDPLDLPGECIKSNELDFVCHVCQEKFIDPSIFANHLKTHSNVEYKCCLSGCNFKFETTTQLVSHLTNHTHSNRSTVIDTVEHKLAKARANYIECRYCSMVLLKRSLLTHLKIKHNEMVPQSAVINDPLGLPEASANLNKLLLAEHLRTHPNVEYKCCLYGCNDKFESMNDLVLHLTNHIKCKTCHKMYVNRPGIVHICRTGANDIEAIFPCPKCDATFVQSSALQVHLSLHRIPSVESDLNSLIENHENPETISEIVSLAVSQQECRIDEYNEEIVAEPCLAHADQLITDPETLNNSENCPKPHQLRSSPVRHKRTCIESHLKKRKKRKISELDEYDEIVEKNQEDNISTHSSESNQDNKSELKSFACLFCTKRFKSRGISNRHMRRFHQKTDVVQKSGVVEQTSIDASRALPNSSEGHPQDNKINFVCYVCEMQFQNPTRFAKHLKTHPNAELKCCFSECKGQFDSIELLIFHLTNHMLVYCKDCNKSYVNHPNSPIHRCMTEADKQFICDYCNKIFYKKENIKRHILLHLNRKLAKKIFVCYICHKDIPTSRQMVIHLQTHPNAELKCCFGDCDERFDSVDIMHRHFVSHLQNQCEICKKSYAHYHKCELPDALGKYICELCGKAFKTNPLFKQHMDIHMDRRPFPCDLCDKAFRRSTALTSHRNSHTGTKPFKCDFENCGRAFVQHNDLHRHRFKAHGIFRKKYPCTICNRVFPENGFLRKHMANHEV